MTQVFYHSDTKAAKKLVLDHHYSHRWCAPVVLAGTWHLPGGLFGDAGPCVAACVFTMGRPWSVPTLELQRLVRHPELPCPSLTGLIAATVKDLKTRRPERLLVSYADTRAGHHGGIYQAASWRYAGIRHGTEGLLIDGEYVPDRTAHNRYGTRSVRRLAERGIQATVVHSKGKHLYWKALDKTGKRLAKQVGLGSLPYPKPSASNSDGSR